MADIVVTKIYSWHVGEMYKSQVMSLLNHHLVKSGVVKIYYKEIKSRIYLKMCDCLPFRRKKKLTSQQKSKHVQSETTAASCDPQGDHGG